MAKKREPEQVAQNMALTNILLVFQVKHEKEGPNDYKTHEDTHTEDLECRVPVGTGRSTELLKRIIWRGVRERYQPDDEYVYAKARFAGERWNGKKQRIDEVEVFRTVMPRKEIAVFIRNL